jgi:hypothetical protein
MLIETGSRIDNVQLELNTIEIFFWFRKSSPGTYRGNSFLIDGKKINSKKDLYTTINNIKYNFRKNKKKTTPFLIIMIINLAYIPVENQTIFKTSKTVYKCLTNNLL